MVATIKICALGFVLLICASLLAGEDAADQKLQPAIQADLSADGAITWWLVQPPAAGVSAELKTPSFARETAGAPKANGWKLAIAPNFYNNFQPFLGAPGKGPLYAAARIESATGGPRMLVLKTYCAVKAYLDGKPVLTQVQPGKLTEFSAVLALPKGDSELILELTPRSGQCLFQCLLLEAAQNGRSRPVPGDTLLFPLAEPMDASQTVAKCAALTLRDAFVKPGDKTAIQVSLPGSTAKGLVGISARAGGREQPLAPGGKCVFELQVPAKLRNVYEIKIEFLVNGKVAGEKSAELLCLEGFLKECAELERDLKARSEKAGRAFPNAALALEKLKLFAEVELGGGDPRAPAPAEEMTQLIDNARKFIPLEEQGKDPFAGRTGYMERAYVSSIDGGVQPYIVSVPAKINEPRDETIPFSLVIFLHGYDPSIDKQRWWEAKDFAAVCERHDCFMAIPFGRSNTDFQSCGEVDVLDVIAEMKKHYPLIDSRRIYVYGYSMGGMAVYTLAAHHPDTFAGGIVMAGRADNPLQNYSALDNFHPFKQFLMQADNPISLCENLLNFPLRIYHGIDDAIVPKTQAMRMNARFKALKADAKLILKPGGHTFGFEVLQEDEPLEWLLSKTRGAHPRNRRMKSYSLAYARQDGVEVSLISGSLDPIELAWSEIDGKKEFQSSSANILLKSVDGVPPPATDFRAQKIPVLCGPLRQAVCAPFTIVYGTKGTPDANASNKANAQKFAEWWFAFTRSRVSAKADADVSADEKLTRNLFLFGEEQENALHAEAAASLPISVKNGTVTIAGRKEPLAGKGVMYFYPSPFAAADKPRALVVCAGIFYGEKIGANHKLDLIPDFLLYGSDTDSDGTSTNRPLCAGFFDGKWKLNDKTTWWFPK